MNYDTENRVLLDSATELCFANKELRDTYRRMKKRKSRVEIIFMLVVLFGIILACVLVSWLCESEEQTDSLISSICLTAFFLFFLGLAIIQIVFYRNEKKMFAQNAVLLTNSQEDTTRGTLLKELQKMRFTGGLVPAVGVAAFIGIVIVGMMTDILDQIWFQIVSLAIALSLGVLVGVFSIRWRKKLRGMVQKLTSFSLPKEDSFQTKDPYKSE